MMSTHLINDTLRCAGHFRITVMNAVTLFGERYGERDYTMPKISRPTRPLADVNVLPRRDGSHEIVVCFMPDPDLLFGGEANARAFLALDASASLKKLYGFGGPF